MVVRNILEIDENKCDGCGLCVPNCYEGALQLVDGKARLISDLFCDGLGACMGHCPKGAIEIVEREAEPYNEIKVLKEMIIPKGQNTIKAHLKHLQDHNEIELLDQAFEYLDTQGIKIGIEKEKPKEFCGCPSTQIKILNEVPFESKNNGSNLNTELRQWPVQLGLLPPQAPFFNNSNLLIAADCVGFANPNIHNQLIKNRSIGITCPKLDNSYKEKIQQIIEFNDLKSITVAIMEVPCCKGLEMQVKDALQDSNKEIEIETIVIRTNGEK